MAKNTSFKQLGKAVTDGIVNRLLRVGRGSRNTFNANRYAFNFTTLDREQLEAMYQGSWISALAVDLMAEDMTREGIDIMDDNPDVIDVINEDLERYQIWNKLCEAIKWSRLYGGAVAIIMMDGDDMSTPLVRIRPDSFRGLMVFDRWQVIPSLGSEVVQKLGPDFGKPMYYELVPGYIDLELANKRIHHSRVLRFEGRQMPYHLREMYQGWGGSVLEPIADRIEAFDLATQGAAQLVSKAYLRYYKVENLRSTLVNEDARRGFEAQMDAMREFQSFEGLTIGDKNDEFQVFSYSFSGLPEILLQFGQQISGGISVPLVRLFGQSPTGFNSTGESDLRTYYDGVRRAQDVNLRPAMMKLLDIIYQSAFSKRPGPNFKFEFKSLWQISSEQKAVISQAQTNAILQALQSGAISTSVALKELKKLSESIGLFASISDEDIEAAEEMDNGMMPPAPEGFDNNGGEQIEGVQRADEDESA